MNRRIIIITIALALPLLASSCGKKQAGGPPPGMSVKVKAVQAERGSLEDKISLVASIAANEVVEIRSEMDGTIAELKVVEGGPVQKGDLLFKLDEEKLQASVAEAEANFKLAEANRARAETMLANNTIAKQEYDQMIATYEARRATLDLMKQQWKDTRIEAPFDGIAGVRMVGRGQVIDRSTPLTTIVDITPVKVDFRVPERFLGQLKTGQSIEFKVAAYPGESFRGEVYFIDPQVDPSTRTVLVKAKQANEDQRLRPGMFGNLDLIFRVKDDAVLIPETALLNNGDATSVYIVDDKGMAQMVPVEAGIRLAGKIEILSGLKGGEKVITEGTQKVFPGVPVMTDEPAPEAPAAS